MLLDILKLLQEDILDIPKEIEDLEDIESFYSMDSFTGHVPLSVLVNYYIVRYYSYRNSRNRIS